MTQKKTYVYKKESSLDICLDHYESPNSKKNQPVIVWFHPGGLILGSREDIPHEQLELYLERGFSVISVDYRLAPETNINLIVEDAFDSIRWIKNNSHKLNIDPNKIAVVGHSAGGYLALLLASSKELDIQAVVSFYGYANFDWYQEPSEHYLKQTLVKESSLSITPKGKPIANSNFQGFADPRWLFYLFCRQKNKWLKKVANIENTDLDKLNKITPKLLITQDFPPTLLLHGDLDEDVPFECSNIVQSILKKNSIKHSFIVMKDCGHMFDKLPLEYNEKKLVGLNHPQVAEAFEKVISFLDENLG